MALSLVLAAAACTPRGSTPEPGHRAEPPVASEDPELTVVSVSAPGGAATDLGAVAVACHYGSTGVVPADGPPPYWVMGVVDLRPGQALQGLTLVSVELLDADGRSMGEGDRELTLRVLEAGATVWAHGDAAFDGRIEAGEPVRLRYRARLPDAFADSSSTPASVQVTLRTEGGAIARISGAVGSQWPTA